MTEATSAGTEPVRVLVVDDQELFRRGLIMLLGGDVDIEVVGEAADGAHALDVVARTRPDVVLMDVRMPGLDGIEATRRAIACRGRGLFPLCSARSPRSAAT